MLDDSLPFEYKVEAILDVQRGGVWTLVSLLPRLMGGIPSILRARGNRGNSFSIARTSIKATEDVLHKLSDGQSLSQPRARLIVLDAYVLLPP